MKYVYAVLRDELDENTSDLFGVFSSHKLAVQSILKARPNCHCTMKTAYDEIDATEYCFEYETYSFTIFQTRLTEEN